MEPPYYFVRDKGSRVAHHWDYERERPTRALCGHEYEGEIVFEGTKRPTSICRACQELLPRFDARWWRETAQKYANQIALLQERYVNAERNQDLARRQIEKLTYQLGLANGRIEILTAKVANQRRNLNDLQSARAAAKRAAQTSSPRKGTASPEIPVIQRPAIRSKP